MIHKVKNTEDQRKGKLNTTREVFLKQEVYKIDQKVI